MHRTRVSFEVGMTQLGGHAIFYSVADSPLGRKESFSDTAKCLSRFVSAVMARVNSKDDVLQLGMFVVVLCVSMIMGLLTWSCVVIGSVHRQLKTARFQSSMVWTTLGILVKLLLIS